MDFDKNNKAKLDTLDELEAGVYIDFLEVEIARHGREVKRAEAYVLFWDSAAERHEMDIKSAHELIDKVKRKFNLHKEGK